MQETDLQGSEGASKPLCYFRIRVQERRRSPSVRHPGSASGRNTPDRRHQLVRPLAHALAPVRVYPVPTRNPEQRAQRKPDSSQDAGLCDGNNMHRLDTLPNIKARQRDNRKKESRLHFPRPEQINEFITSKIPLNCSLSYRLPDGVCPSDGNEQNWNN